jgi:hypothetical protein
MNWHTRLRRGLHILAEHAPSDSPRTAGRLLRPSQEDAVIGLLYAVGGCHADQPDAGADRGGAAPRTAAPASRPAAYERAAAR